MNILESIVLAFTSIKVYKIRAVLTLLSIAIGVFAIMGAGTLVNSIDSAVNDELSDLGENSFLIKKMPSIQMGDDWRKFRKRKSITYSQYRELKERMPGSAIVSAKSDDGGNIVEYGNLSTDPDVDLIGADENYFLMQNLSIDPGRAMTAEDLNLNRRVAVIGNDIVVDIFPHTDPLGKEIRIKNQKFTVIGVLEAKGAILGQSQDNRVIIPLSLFLKYYADWWDESLSITVKAPSKAALVPTIDEAIGIMRTIRNVKPWEENNFELETNETISEQFGMFTQFLGIFGASAGIIALIAAGVGIMNIMLVSVKERTREIGVRKAVGAKRSWILYQFIVETITLCLIGGLIGIGMGIVGAAFLGKAINIEIVFPLFWFIFSLIICTAMGVIFGAYPAWQAAKLDPIDALRYE